MIKQFGILVENIGPHQHGLCILKNCTELLQKDYQYSPIIFYHSYGTPYLNTNVSMMTNIEAWSFNGPLIANDIFTAAILDKCTASRNKYFYIWDLEWIYMQNRHFDMFKTTYLNPDIELIARNESHARLIEKVWKKPTAIIEDFNYEKLLSTISR